jgi:hypothetical protein
MYNEMGITFLSKKVLNLVGSLIRLNLRKEVASNGFHRRLSKSLFLRLKSRCNETLETGEDFEEVR